MKKTKEIIKQEMKQQYKTTIGYNKEIKLVTNKEPHKKRYECMSQYETDTKYNKQIRLLYFHPATRTLSARLLKKYQKKR